METNLWNVDIKKNSKKTKNVIAYIQEIELPFGPNYNIKKFDKIKMEALNKLTPDEMLRTIGYRFGKKPLIFNWCHIK